MGKGIQGDFKEGAFLPSTVLVLSHAQHTPLLPHCSFSHTTTTNTSHIPLPRSLRQCQPSFCGTAPWHQATAFGSFTPAFRGEPRKPPKRVTSHSAFPISLWGLGYFIHDLIGSTEFPNNQRHFPTWAGGERRGQWEAFH